MYRPRIIRCFFANITTFYENCHHVCGTVLVELSDPCVPVFSFVAQIKIDTVAFISHFACNTSAFLYFFFFFNADDETFAELLTELSKARTKTTQRYRVLQ